MSLSIILPTYNESQNIVNLLNKIHDKLRPGTPVEVVVVDDNSPDGTGRLVEEYARSIGTPISKTTNSAMKTTTISNYEMYNRSEDLNTTGYLIKVIYRAQKYGLMSAILQGI